MQPLRILYIAPMNYGWYGLYRQRSLERLGHTVFPVDIMQYEGRGNPWLARLRYRLQIGKVVDQMNDDVLRLARQHRVDAVWFDKPLFIHAATLRQLRAWGIATIDYMIDNPFGPRRDPGFRLYVRTIPEYDLHVQQRDVSVRAYLQRGARHVVKVQTAFEPSVHFPPPAEWSDADRTRQVSFIGTPYDQRPGFLTELWQTYKLPVIISGPRIWRRKLSAAALTALYPQDGELYDAEYREGVWRSKINLSFLTHGNQDEYAHKSFEIAACGGFLLAERSPGHSERFVEDEEAAFFSGTEECAEKIRRYLPDAAARMRIASAGQRRAATSGYDNDTQLAKVMKVVWELLPGVRSGRTQS
ncbi:MAG TPA: glycosyltransferase [Acidobacteriaceae bacterium]|nr:glycosyltransferase [Acidobacteriaceae bacterium]